MDHILDGLNDAQRAAVTSPSDVLQVLAPPGSGKTKTLTARVAHMIAHRGISPNNIIVCTFTVKASREMKERIEGLLGNEQADRLILGTFHSICRRLLLKYGRLIDLDNKFGISDMSDTKAIVTRIIKHRNFTVDPMVAVSRISTRKCNGAVPQPPKPKGPPQNTQEEAEKKLTEELECVFEEYNQELKAQNLLDYDDLLLRCEELLRRFPRCVKYVQAVLIDEFQDTSNVQYDLMVLFAQARKVVTIVGDPDQSIYGWRNARIENLIKMRETFTDTMVVNLEENYRSSACILLSAQALIEQDNSRHEKTLLPTHSAGERPVLRNHFTADQEAAWIAAEIRRSKGLTGGLLGFKDFAILFRSAFLTRVVEQALIKATIPYRMVGGTRFFDRAEVKLLLDYLRFIDNVQHFEALTRILNMPTRGIGPKTLDALRDVAKQRKCDLWQALLHETSRMNLSGRQCEGTRSFVKLIERATKKLSESKNLSLPGYIRWLMDEIGLIAFVKKKHPEEKDYAPRIDNLREFLAYVRAFSQGPSDLDGSFSEGDEGDFVDELSSQPSSQPSSQAGAIKRPTRETLTVFLSELALITDTKTQQEDESDTGTVTLATMHAAKGLEWPVVFVPAVYEGIMPHSRSEDTDEERRLLYVAMTRAQALLYLSHPERTTRSEEAQVSQFLDKREVGETLCDRGPRFDYDLVRELAKILRREGIPLDIEAGRSKVDYFDDDDFEGHYQEARRRAREEKESQTGAGSASQKRGLDSVSKSGAGTGSGFTSARDVIALNNKENLPPPKKKQAKGQDGWQQQTLSFAKPAEAAEVEHKPDAKVEEPPRAMAIKEPQSHVKVEETYRSVKVEGGAASAAPKPPVAAKPWQASGVRQFRPHTSMHTTTMDRIQGQPAGPPVTGTRTLGAKPSMNGWQQRMSRAQP